MVIRRINGERENKRVRKERHHEMTANKQFMNWRSYECTITAQSVS